MSGSTMHPHFDWPTASELLNLYKERGPNVHGSLFDESIQESDWSNHRRSRRQTEFLGTVLGKTRPRNIVEIGTHCGQFCLFARNLLSGQLHIDTFSDEERGEACIDLLNERYGHYIDFYVGNSCDTFSSFSAAYPVDFVWLDGGHQYEVALSDLGNCARLCVPHICIDDVNHSAVRQAVDKFLFEYPIYKIISKSRDVSATSEWRGVFYISSSRSTQLLAKLKNALRKVRPA